jgi:hypothetical protein
MTRNHFIHELLVRWIAKDGTEGPGTLIKLAHGWADDIADQVPFDAADRDDSNGEYVELCQVIHRPPDGNPNGYACTLPKDHDGPMHVCGLGKTRQWPLKP